MSVSCIRKASQSLSVHTDDRDSIHPRHYQHMSDQTLSNLMRVYAQIEAFPVFPEHVSEVTIALIDKPLPQTGDRP